MLGIRKCTVPRAASCARIRHFCWHHHMHPVLHGLDSPDAHGEQTEASRMHTGANWGPPDAHGVQTEAPRMHTGADWGPPNAHGMQTEAPLMHTGCKLRPPDAHGCWLRPPGCTRDANWGPPDAHGVLTEAIIFMSKPVVRTNWVTELLELRKVIGIQANDLSVYNIFQRISYGCHGRAERGAMLLETCIG